MKKILFGLLLLLSATNFMQARFFLGIDTGLAQGIVQSHGDLITTKPDKTSIEGIYQLDSSKGFAPAVLFNLGTEHLFWGIFGFRLSLGAGYQALAPKDRLLPVGTFKDYNTRINELHGIRFDAASDIMLNFFNNQKFAFGIFGGLQYNLYLAKFSTKDIDLANHFIILGSGNDGGNHTVRTQGFNGENIFMNSAYRVGLSMMFDNHHRLEFYISRNFFNTTHKKSDRSIVKDSKLETIETLKIGVNTYMLSYKYVF